MDWREEVPVWVGEGEQYKNKVFTHPAILTHLQTVPLHDFACVSVCVVGGVEFCLGSVSAVLFFTEVLFFFLVKMGILQVADNLEGEDSM